MKPKAAFPLLPLPLSYQNVLGNNVLHLLCDKFHLSFRQGKTARNIQSTASNAFRYRISFSFKQALLPEHRHESMLRMTAHGVAMSNGLPQIREAAAYVTRKSNDEDGIADFLEAFVL